MSPMDGQMIGRKLHVVVDVVVPMVLAAAMVHNRDGNQLSQSMNTSTSRIRLGLGGFCSRRDFQCSLISAYSAKSRNLEAGSTGCTALTPRADASVLWRIVRLCVKASKTSPDKVIFGHISFWRNRSKLVMLKACLTQRLSVSAQIVARVSRLASAISMISS